jgi:hypothetical protein
LIAKLLGSVGTVEIQLLIGCQIVVIVEALMPLVGVGHLMCQA